MTGVRYENTSFTLLSRRRHTMAKKAVLQVKQNIFVSLPLCNWSPEVIVKLLNKCAPEDLVWKYVSMRARFMWEALTRNQKLNKSEDGEKVQG